MRTTTVIDGKLCIEQDGVKVWFTLSLIDKHINRLEEELCVWRERRLTLASSGLAQPAPKLDEQTLAPTAEAYSLGGLWTEQKSERHE